MLNLFSNFKYSGLSYTLNPKSKFNWLTPFFTFKPVIYTDNFSSSNKTNLNTVDNPCSSCCIEQECCRKLQYLRLSKSEYLQNFVKHKEKILVQNFDETYLVSSKEDQPCPNWSNNKCMVYLERPIECKIFPNTIGTIQKNFDKVLITYNERTGCPQKKDLLISDNEVKELVLSFAHEAFGDKYFIKVKRENLILKWVANLKNKIIG